MDIKNCPLCGDYLTDEEVVSTTSRVTTYITYCENCSAEFVGDDFSGFGDEHEAADAMRRMLNAKHPFGYR